MLEILLERIIMKTINCKVLLYSLKYFQKRKEFYKTLDNKVNRNVIEARALFNSTPTDLGDTNLEYLLSIKRSCLPPFSGNNP